MQDTLEYRLIAEFYGTQTARRSGVPLINHINEGLVVLNSIGSTEQAKRAFCLHPLLQADADLQANYHLVSGIDPHVVMLAMEYRSVANEFLSDKMDLAVVPDVRLSPLTEVNEMLIADKVQNYKDFTKHHYGTHPRSDKLNDYFHKWFAALDINLTMYRRLYKLIDASKV
jgi:hypothetical protein